MGLPKPYPFSEAQSTDYRECGYDMAAGAMRGFGWNGLPDTLRSAGGGDQYGSSAGMVAQSVASQGGGFWASALPNADLASTINQNIASAYVGVCAWCTPQAVLCTQQQSRQYNGGKGITHWVAVYSAAWDVYNPWLPTYKKMPDLLNFYYPAVGCVLIGRDGWPKVARTPDIEDQMTIFNYTNATTGQTSTFCAAGAFWWWLESGQSVQDVQGRGATIWSSGAPIANINAFGVPADKRSADVAGVSYS